MCGPAAPFSYVLPLNGRLRCRPLNGSVLATPAQPNSWRLARKRLSRIMLTAALIAWLAFIALLTIALVAGLTFIALLAGSTGSDALFQFFHFEDHGFVHRFCVHRFCTMLRFSPAVEDSGQTGATGVNP